MMSSESVGESVPSWLQRETREMRTEALQHGRSYKNPSTLCLTCKSCRFHQSALFSASASRRQDWLSAESNPAEKENNNKIIKISFKCQKIVFLRQRNRNKELTFHQICHDDCVHDDRLGGSSQGELEATWRLAWAHVKTMAFQQKMLQLVLSCHNVLHLWAQRQRKVKVLSRKKGLLGGHADRGGFLNYVWERKDSRRNFELCKTKSVFSWQEQEVRKKSVEMEQNKETQNFMWRL